VDEIRSTTLAGRKPVSTAGIFRLLLNKTDDRCAAEHHGYRAPAVLICALLAASSGLVCAGAPDLSPSTIDLKQLSVEQLMNIEVTSVSKQPQKLLQAASAIQVVTSDDIRRSGATTIPEALRLADNLQVAQENSHDWAISARGFNANLANKLLVLIDGRAIYTPLYGGVLWNVQDYLLQDIDRIEVISGPGGTLWGANAVNGIINIITKSAQDTQGLYAQAAGGKELQGLAGGRVGTELAPDVYLRVYGKYLDRGDEDTNSGASAADAWHVSRGGFRMDAAISTQDQLSVQGDIYSGTEGDGAAGDEALSGGNVLGRWTRTMSSDSTMSLQAYYDHTYLSVPFAASPPAAFYTGFPAASLTDALDTYDLDFQYHFALGERHRLVWGLGYRATHETDEDVSVVRFSPAVLEQNLYSGFLQDEIMLAPSVDLTIGSKLEHNDYTGFEVEPSARLQWSLTSKEMLWTAVSRAVRTPSRYDRDLAVPSGLVGAPPPYQFPTDYLKGGGANFVSENLIAYEIGYRAQLGPKLSGSVSTYYNDYNDLRSTTATPTTALYPFPYPVYFQNNLEGDSYGIELSATYLLLDWWRLHAGYDLLQEHIRIKPGQVDATDATNETADPHGQSTLRSSMDLPRNVQLDAALRWVDALHINNGPTGGPVIGIVPSYFEFDTRIAWHATKKLELSIVGQNLLHDHHPEYGYPSPSREEIERTIYGKISWGY
jgi:iron complex outermembrane receptor protein